MENPSPAATVATPPPLATTRPKGLHHIGYVTADAARTADFYTRVLGLRFIGTVINEKVPSTGDDFPYIHLFFEMADGSTIAFFESPGLPPPAGVSHPAYGVFNHLALDVGSKDAVDQWAAHLRAQGVDFVGPIDHEVIYSLYLSDPNGVRVELTCTTGWGLSPEQATDHLRRWEAAKALSREQGSMAPMSALVDELKGSYKKTAH